MLLFQIRLHIWGCISSSSGESIVAHEFQISMLSTMAFQFRKDVLEFSTFLYLTLSEKSLVDKLNYLLLLGPVAG